MNGRARLARYALWQAVDFIFERAAAIVLILGVMLYLAHLAIGATPRPPGSDVAPEVLRALAPVLMNTLLGTTWIAVGVLAANGISSNDRATGRFRFLFSKPLRADAFYAQAFGVNVVLAVACLASAVLLLCNWTAAPASFVGDALLVAASGVVGISGLCFLFSAVWRFDWAATIGVMGTVALLRFKFPTASWLQYLPPTDAVNRQITNIGAQLPVDRWSLLRFVIFGLLCFAAGLVILRRRPLST